MARSSESTIDYSSEMYGSLLVYRNDGEKGPIYDLSEGTTKIGASIDADIRLKLQDSRLEEVHCVVQVEENGTALLMNKSSEAPVIVNGDVLSQKKYRILKHEDYFVVLGKKFQYLNEHIAEQDYQKTVSANRKSVAPILQTTSTKIPVQQRTVKPKTENSGRLKNFLTPNEYTKSRTCTGVSKTTSKLVVSKSFSKLPTPRRRLSLNLVPQVLGAAKRTSIPKKACDCCVELIDTNSPNKSLLKKSTPLKSRKSLLLKNSTKLNSFCKGKDRSLPIEKADKMQDSSVSSSVDDSCDEEDLKLMLLDEDLSSQRCSKISEIKSTTPSVEVTPERMSRSSRSSARRMSSSVILDNETDLEAKALEASKRLSRRMYRSLISSVGDAVDNSNLTENISNSSKSQSVRKRTSLVNDEMMPVEADTLDRTSTRKGTSSFDDICSSTKMRSVIIDHLNDNKNESTPGRISRGVFRSSSSRRMSSLDDSRDEEDLKLLLSEEEFPSQICSSILESKSTSSSEEENKEKILRSAMTSARGTSSVILDNDTDLEANALEVSKRLSSRMYRSSISSVGDAVDGGHLAENIPNSTRSPSVTKTASSVNDGMLPVEAETLDRPSRRKRASSFADCSSSTKKRSSSLVIDHENESKNEKTLETSKRISRSVLRSSSSRRTSSFHDAIDCSSPLDESTPQISRRLSRNMNKSSVHNHIEESDSALPLRKTKSGMNISRSSTMRRTVSSTSVDNLVVVLQEKLPKKISRSSIKGRKSSIILGEQNDMITWDVESPEINKSLVMSTVISSTKRKKASLVSPTMEEIKIESDLCSDMIRSSTPADNMVVISNGKSPEISNLPEEMSSAGKTSEMMSRSSVRVKKSIFVSDEEKTASPETSGRNSRKLNGSLVEAMFADSASPSKEKTLETISRSTGVRRTVSSTSLDNLVVVLQEKSPENNQRYSRNLEIDSTLALEEKVPETISMSRRMERSSTLDKDTPESSQRSSRSAKRSSIQNQPEGSNNLTLPTICRSSFGDVDEENVKIRKPDTSQRISSNNLIPEISLKNRKSLSRSRSMRGSSLIEFSDNSFDEEDTEGSSLRLSSSSLTSEFDLQNDEQTTSQISFRRSSMRASLKRNKSPSGHSEDIIGQSPLETASRESSLRGSTERNSSVTERSFDQESNEVSSNRRSSSSIRSQSDLENEEQRAVRSSSVRTPSKRNLLFEDNVSQSPLDIIRKSTATRCSLEINSSLSYKDMEDSFVKKENERSSNNRRSLSVRSQSDTHIEDSVGSSHADANRKSSLSRGSLKKKSSVELSDNDRANSFDQDEIESDLQNEDQMLRRSSVRTYSKRNMSSEDNVGQSPMDVSRKSSLRGSVKINSSVIELSDNDMEHSFDQEEIESDLQNEDRVMLSRSSVRTYSRRNASSEDNFRQSPLDVSRKSLLGRGSLKMNSTIEISDNDIGSSFDQGEISKKRSLLSLRSENDLQEDQTMVRRSSSRTPSKINVPLSRHPEDIACQSSLEAAANIKSSPVRRSLKINSAIEISDNDMENSFDQEETSNRRRSSSSFGTENDLQHVDQIRLRRSVVKTYSRRNTSAGDNIGQSPMDVNRKSSFSNSLEMNSATDMEDSFDQEETESDIQKEDQIMLRRSSIRTHSRRNVYSEDNVCQSPLDVTRKSSPSRCSLKINSPAIDLPDNDMDNSYNQRGTSNMRSSSSFRSDNDLQNEDQTTFRRSSARTLSKTNVPSSRNPEDIAGQSSLDAANRKSSLSRGSVKINSSTNELADDVENSSDQEVTERASNRRSSLSVRSPRDPQIGDQIMLHGSSVRTPSKRNASEDNIDLKAVNEISSSRTSAKINSSAIKLFDNDRENSSDQEERERSSNRRSSSSIRSQCDPQIEDQIMLRRSSVRKPSKRNVSTEDTIGQSPSESANEKSSISRRSANRNSSIVEPFESPAEGFGSDSKQNRNKEEDLATPKSSAKKCRPDDALYQPETENVSPVTPENKIKGPAEGGFKTPINTPGLFDEIRKSMLKSRTRLQKSTGNVAEELSGENRREEHGVKRQRVSGGSTRRSCKKMRLVINADDTFEKTEPLDSFQSDNVDEPPTAIVNSIFDSDENMVGVKKMFATPKVAKSPKNDVPNLRKIMFPKTQNSPNNDLTDVVGVKRLMKTPKKKEQQQRESFFLEGVAELLASPRKEGEAELAGSDIENNEELFDRLFVRRRPRQYRGKTMSPKGRGTCASEGGDRRKTAGDVPATPSPRVRHWVEEQRQRMKGMKEETSGSEKSEVSKNDINLDPFVSMSPQKVVVEQTESTEISDDEAENAEMKPLNKKGRNAKTVKRHVEEEKPVRTINRRGKNAGILGVKDEEKSFDEQKPIKTINRRGKNARTFEVTDGTDVEVEDLKPVNIKGRNFKTVELEDNTDAEKEKPVETVNKGEERTPKPIERRGKHAKTVKFIDGTDVEEEKQNPVTRGRNARTVVKDDEEENPKTVNRKGRNVKNVEEKPKRKNKRGNAKTMDEEIDLEEKPVITLNRRGKNVKPGQVEEKNHVNDAEEAEEKCDSEKPALRRGRNAKAVDPSDQKANESVDKEESVKSANRRGRNFRLNVDEQGEEIPAEKTKKVKVKVTRNKGAKATELTDEDLKSVDGRRAVEDAEEAEEKGESKKPALRRGRYAKAVDPSDQRANESVDKEDLAKPANRRGRNFRLNLNEEIEKQDEEGRVEKTMRGKAKVTRNEGGKENEDLKSVDSREAVEDAEEAEEIGELRKPALRRGRNAKAVDPSDQKAIESVYKEESIKPANKRGRNLRSNVDEEIEKQNKGLRKEGIENTTKGKAKVTRNRGGKENDEDLKSVNGRKAVEDAEVAEGIGESKKPALRRGRNVRAVAPNDQKPNGSIVKEDSVTPAIRNVDEVIEKEGQEEAVEKTKKGKGKVTRNEGSEENDEVESVDGRGAASGSKRVLRGRRKASIDEEVVVPAKRGRKDKIEVASAEQQVQTKAEQKLRSKVKSKKEEETPEKRRPRRTQRNEKKEEAEEVEEPVEKTRSRGNAAEKVTGQSVQDDSLTPRQTRAQRGNHKESDYESGGSRRRNNRARF